MWSVKKWNAKPGYWVSDDILKAGGKSDWRRYVWPVNASVDLGTATTMCDAFNARDYPEQFNKCGK